MPALAGFVATRPLSPSQIPNPTALTKGGVISSTAPANQFATGINTSAAVLPMPSRPFSNLATGSISVPATWLSKQTHGSGTYAATANYGAGTTATLFQQVTGSWAPHQPVKTLRLFSKMGGVTSTSGVNSTLYSSIYKTTTAANHPCLCNLC